MLPPHPANQPRRVTSSGVLTPVAMEGRSSGLTASKPSSENCGVRACPTTDPPDQRLLSAAGGGGGDGRENFRGGDDSGSTPRCC